MKVLGIETSCDETSLAVVDSGTTILAHETASQSDLHASYAGVVPELASRKHSADLFPLLEKMLQRASLSLKQIDLVAVTHTPGLHGALVVGVQAAKGLSLGLNKPLVCVHHIEAHLYAAWMSFNSTRSKERRHQTPEHSLFPALGLVLSGGHTQLWKIYALGNYQLLSQSLDDAIGEAFDKAAVMLGLSYPGGSQIEALAKEGDPLRYCFKAGRSKKEPNAFSYSGLKTQLMHHLWGHNLKKLNAMCTEHPLHIGEKERADLAASFQRAIFQDLLEKIRWFVKNDNPQTLWVGGGVCANKSLRELFSRELPLPILWPVPELSTDNAAMVAGLGYHQWKGERATRADPPILPRSSLRSWSLLPKEAGLGQ